MDSILNNKKTLFKEALFLFITFIISFYLRSYHINAVFISSDDAQHNLFALNLFHRSALSLTPSNNLFAGILSSHYGLLPFIIFIYIWALSLLRVTINETVLTLLPIILSSFIPIAVYFLIKKLHSPLSAKLSALTMAVLPFAVFRSNNSWTMGSVVPYCFSIFGIYFLICYFETKKNYLAWLASFFICLFLTTSVMYLGILPIIFFTSYIYNAKDKHGLLNKFKYTLMPLNKKQLLIFPAIIFTLFGIAYLYALFVLHDQYAGFIGYLFAKKKAIGFYLVDMIIYYKHNLGNEFFCFTLLGCAFGIIQLLKFSRTSILFIWFFIFTAPFLFITPPDTTIIWAYLVDSQLSLLLLTIIALCNLALIIKKKIRLLYNFSQIFMAIFLAALFLYTFGQLINHKMFKSIFSGPTSDWPLYQVDNGLKSAGFFIRENNLNKGDLNIFTDGEPMVAHYYFGKNKIFCQYDSNIKNNLAYFKEISNYMDILVIDSQDAEKYLFIASKAGKEFYKIAEIRFEKQPIRDVYYLKNCPLRIIESERCNLEFDSHYGRIEKLVPQKIDFVPTNHPQV